VSRAQSLIEFALIAPILIVLAMAVWDGGSALREQVVLDEAARDGARAGATAFGGAQQSVIQDAVLASAADLPALASSGGYLTITSDSQSITVGLRYPHVLITPVLRQLWSGGQGTLMLSASSTFFVPQLTPVPATVVPSTPIPSPTPTSTPTPAAVLPNPCSLIPNAGGLPALANNTGFWCTLRLGSAASVLAYWQDNGQANNQLQIYAGTPLDGQSDPSSAAPPDGAIGVMYRSTAGVLSGSSIGCLQPGTYTVYFFDRGARIDATNANVSASAC
jgi:Flp pilus assembly protein TadG